MTRAYSCQGVRAKGATLTFHATRGGQRCVCLCRACARARTHKRCRGFDALAACSFHFYAMGWQCCGAVHKRANVREEGQTGAKTHGVLWRAWTSIARRVCDTVPPLRSSAVALDGPCQLGGRGTGGTGMGEDEQSGFAFRCERGPNITSGASSPSSNLSSGGGSIVHMRRRRAICLCV